MNAIIYGGVAILLFGVLVWVRSIYITWKGFKTTATVTGHSFFKEYDRNSRRYYEKEYPTITYYNEDGLITEGHVKYLVTKDDRLKNGEKIDILVYGENVLYGHDVTIPLFFYLGLTIIIIGLIVEAFTLDNIS